MRMVKRDIQGNKNKEETIRDVIRKHVEEEDEREIKNDLSAEEVDQGLTKEQLAGITLESVAISTRVAEAVRRMEQQGRMKSEDYPLLMHVDDLISRGAALDIPWEKFETII